MKKLLNFTFGKFLIVGVINTIFGTAIMFGCYNLLHYSYWISTAANYFFGSILSYLLNKHFTFQNKERGLKPLIRFTINIVVCYVIAYGIAKPAVAHLLKEAPKTLQENGAMFVGMCLFVLLNYFGQRFFAFRKKQS